MGKHKKGGLKLHRKRLFFKVLFINGLLKRFKEMNFSVRLNSHAFKLVGMVGAVGFAIKAFRDHRVTDEWCLGAAYLQEVAYD